MKGIRASILILTVLVFMLLPLAACSSTPSTTTSAFPPAATQAKAPTAAQAPAAPAKVYEFKWADHLPPTHDMNVVAEEFAKRVSEKTNGQVKFTFYHAETLAKMAELMGALDSGVCDVVTCVAASYPGQFNMYLGANMPGLGIPDRTVGNEIRWKLFEEGYFTDLAPYKVLGFVDVGVQKLWMRDKKITKIVELKGLKIKGANAANNAMLENAGATPISMSGAEEYMALSRNTIDGLTTGWENVTGSKEYEVLKYGIWNSVNDGNMVWLMNKAKWNQLPPDVQAAIDKIMPDFKSYLIDYFKKDTTAQQLLKDKGMEIYTLPAEEWAIMQNAAMPYIDKYISDNEAKGRPAKKMVDEIKKIAAAAGS